MKTLQQVAFETLARFAELKGGKAEEICLLQDGRTYAWLDSNCRSHKISWEGPKP